MCGIVGYIGREDAVHFLTPALKRLEYRGYDSAGVATLNGRGGLDVRKSAGQDRRARTPAGAGSAVGPHRHRRTRAGRRTAGRPTSTRIRTLDCRGRIAVVHNGIIENYRELRDELRSEGHLFRSDTDTEVIAHLIERYCRQRLARGRVSRGASSCAGRSRIACIVRVGPTCSSRSAAASSPLVVGRGEASAFVASDVPALARPTRRAPCPWRRRSRHPDASRTSASAGWTGTQSIARRRRLPRISPRSRSGGYRALHAQGDLRAAEGVPAIRSRAGRPRRRPRRARRASDSTDASWPMSTASPSSAAARRGTRRSTGHYLVEELARMPADVADRLRAAPPPRDRRRDALAVPDHAIGRDGRHADRAAAGQVEPAPAPCDHQRRRQLGHARVERRALHARRPRDRRRGAPRLSRADRRHAAARDEARRVRRMLDRTGRATSSAARGDADPDAADARAERPHPPHRRAARRSHRQRSTWAVGCSFRWPSRARSS